MKIYLICPVTIATEEDTKFAKEYVEHMEQVMFHDVFWPQRDAPQDDLYGLVDMEINAIKECDEVHIIWNRDSKGSHFDLGVAMAFNKPLILVKSTQPDIPDKSYEKVIRKKANEFSTMRLYL